MIESNKPATAIKLVVSRSNRGVPTEKTGARKTPEPGVITAACRKGSHCNCYSLRCFCSCHGQLR
jgi:hypothetical protein